jgi:hypothetical protein
VNARRNQPGGNSTQSVNVVPLGQAANAFGNFYIGKSLLQYEPAINTVTLLHRNSPAITGDPNTGYYRYDKSTDGGITWTNDLGPLYGPVLNATDTKSGRYPVGAIGNPVGNSNPDNAYEAYDGVWINAGSWHGQCWGAGKLDNTSHTEHSDSADTNGNMVWINDIFATKQNVIWRMGAVEADNQGAYSNYLRVEKGTFTGSDYNYTFQDLHFKTNPDLNNIRPYDMNIAFSDDGMTGYAVNYPTGVMYLQMYITTDGGATWAGSVADPANTPRDLDVQYTVGNPWFGNPDSTFGVQGWGASRPDFDMAVDGNGNLHIFTAVFPQSNFGESLVDTGTWGLADLYTTDHGATWYGQLVAKPNTYAGNYGDPTNIQEGNRPFVTRSNDGMKLFFGWYDTPPDFATPLNDFPELYVCGLDIATNMWTPDTDMTFATAADGICTFGLGAYYAKDAGCTFTIPAAFMTMQVDMNGPCDFNYIDGVNLTCADFIIPGTPLFLQTTHCNASFSLYPDTATLHLYWVVNNATGIAPINYVWDWGDGNQDTIAYPSHNYAVGGYYNICLTITDDTGCVSMRCDSTMITAHNGSGNEHNVDNTMITVNVIPPITTGIHAPPLTGTFSVYPNPFTSTVSILAPGNKNLLSYRLISMHGVGILKGSMTGEEYKLNLDALSAGIYLLEITNETGFKTYRKLIKE